MAAFAEDTKVPLANLKATFDALQTYAEGKAKDPFGKSMCIARPLALHFGLRLPPANFANSLYSLDEPLLVAEMTPVVHYVSSSCCCAMYVGRRVTHHLDHRRWAA